MFNPHIARSLREEPSALEILRTLGDDDKFPDTLGQLARDTLRRAEGWAAMENLLAASDMSDSGRFADAEKLVSWLLSFICEPEAFSILLLNLTLLASPLEGNMPIPPVASIGSATETGQCLSFVRAIQGVASLAAIVCWAIYDENTALVYRLLHFLSLLSAYDYGEVCAMLCFLTND